MPLNYHCLRGSCTLGGTVNKHACAVPAATSLARLTSGSLSTTSTSRLVSNPARRVAVRFRSQDTVQHDNALHVGEVSRVMVPLDSRSQPTKLLASMGTNRCAVVTRE